MGFLALVVGCMGHSAVLGIGLLNQQELITEVYDEALSWFLENPGMNRLPLDYVKRIQDVGLELLPTEDRLLRDRQAESNE